MQHELFFISTGRLFEFPPTYLYCVYFRRNMSDVRTEEKSDIIRIPRLQLTSLKSCVTIWGRPYFFISPIFLFLLHPQHSYRLQPVSSLHVKQTLIFLHQVYLINICEEVFFLGKKKSPNPQTPSMMQFFLFTKLVMCSLQSENNQILNK